MCDTLQGLKFIGQSTDPIEGTLQGDGESVTIGIDRGSKHSQENFVAPLQTRKESSGGLSDAMAAYDADNATTDSQPFCKCLAVMRSRIKSRMASERSW